MTKTAKNNAYTLEVGSPLLRPGLTIRTTVSAAYASTAADNLMLIVREINNDKDS